MLTLNVKFQEEYKRLDRLCKDYLSSTEGVSEYIRQMELTPQADRWYVYTWESDYKQLKHMRWVRNQLAHEVGTLDSDICTEEDLSWVQCFYDRIMDGQDPFTTIRKAKEEIHRRARRQAQLRKAEAELRARRQAEAKAAGEAASTKQLEPAEFVGKDGRSEPSRPSLWSRLTRKIKNLFS